MADSKLHMLQAWADIVLERWTARMSALEVGSTGELLRSLRAQVETDSNGDAGKIVFTFLLYGRFVDMGVGRGVKLGSSAANRTKKPWYSTVFLREVNKLGLLMAERYGIEAAMAISAFGSDAGNTKIVRDGSK